MRMLTFETFLKRYVKDVSGQKSLSIHKLSILSKDNIRIVSPLILLCLFSNKMEIFFTYFNNGKNQDLKSLTTKNFLDDKFSKYDFEKIYQSFIRKTKTKEYNDDIKLMVRERIVESMIQKKITKYRIYTDLKLNPGNVNDFLTNSNCHKVSLDLAKRIYDYCLSF